MDEMITLLEEIRDLLSEMNSKLDDIKGIGIYSSIADVCDKLDAISGSGLNNLDDVCNKLDDIKGSGLNSIDDVCTKLDDITGSGLYGLNDVCDKLDSLDTTIMLK